MTRRRALRFSTALALVLLLGAAFAWAVAAQATCCCSESAVSAPCARECEMAPSTDCRAEETIPSTSRASDSAPAALQPFVFDFAPRAAAATSRLHNPREAWRAFEMTPLLRKTALII